jgi:protein-disulfide isomerase
MNGPLVDGVELRTLRAHSTELMLGRSPEIRRRAVVGAVLAAGGLLVFAHWRSRQSFDVRSVDFEPHGAPALGSPSAPITMVYYTDYRCAECRAFANETLLEIRRRYVDSGRLRIVIRELARSEESVASAVGARCAGEFGKYWAFHDSLFAATDVRMTIEALHRIAARTGLPADPFSRCLAANRYAAVVRAETDRAKPLSTSHVPTVVIGIASARAILGGRADGSLSEVDSLIESELRR